MSSLEIALFGGIHMQIDGQTVTLPYDKVRALLAYLLLEGKRPLRRETLVGLLWPEQPEKEARHSLSQALLKLRKNVDTENDFIVADRHTISLNPTTHIDVDATRFITTLQQCDTHPHPQPDLCKSCMAQRESAVALYTGPLLAGLSLPDAAPFEQWLTQQREAYQRRAMAALAALAASHERRGELTQAVEYARRQLALEPWLEEAHYQLMRLLLYKGQRSSAIAQYLSCVQVLADEFGVEPSPKTTALFKMIQTAAAEPPHNLPTSPTPFVGRQAELAHLTNMLANGKGRLITIVGLGGMGKSRLALSTAMRQLGRPSDEAIYAENYAFFTHGVYWVPLAGFTSATALIPAIADVVELQIANSDGGFASRSPLQQLLDFLRKKRLLLVLDNFEQLLGAQEATASTSVIRAILQHAANVYLLVTSRERLRLQEETLFWLDGLSFPEVEDKGGDAYSAVALFEQTAERLQARPFDQSEKVTVAAICRLLRGTPLAIELAANAVHALSLDDILSSLQYNLTLLETDNRHVPHRHRSMEAAFTTSWQRLSADVQRSFAKLSVFQNGFTLEAAQAVAQATPQLLSTLISHSLLQFEPHQKRYHLHELLRQFAEQKLAATEDGSEASVHEAHALYYLNFLAAQDDALKGAQQTAALKGIDADFENGRLAWRWACAQEPEWLAAAVHPLFLYHDRRGRHQEGAEACLLAINAYQKLGDGDSELDRTRGRLYAWYGRFLITLNQWDVCRHAIEKSLALLKQFDDGGSDRAFALLQQSRLYWRMDKETAQKLALHALTLAQKEDDPWRAANCLNLLGRMARARGQFALTNDYLAKSLSIRHSINDQNGTAHTLSHLSLLMMDLGHFDQARTYAQQSLTLFQEMHDAINVANATNSLGLIQSFAGDYRDGERFFAKSKSIFEAMGMTLAAEMTQIWRNLGSMMLYGDYEAVVEAQLKVYRAFDAAGNRRGMAYASLGLAFCHIGANQYETAMQFAQSGMMLFARLEQTKEAAECSGFAALAAAGEKRQAEAARHFGTYAAFMVKTRTFFAGVISMLLVVLDNLERKEVRRALELYTALKQLPFVANGCWYADVIGQSVETAAQKLPPKVRAQAQKRGEQLDFWETAVNILESYPNYTPEGP